MDDEKILYGFIDKFFLFHKKHLTLILIEYTILWFTVGLVVGIIWFM